MINIHGTLVNLNGKGILLVGKSGAGKSDLALRLIMDRNASLVADDRVDIIKKDGFLYGSSPKNLSGLLEIRGVGLRKFPATPNQKIDLCIELCSDRDIVTRYPDEDHVDFLGISVKKIRLYPFDCSTIYKIVVTLDDIKT